MIRSLGPCNPLRSHKIAKGIFGNPWTKNGRDLEKLGEKAWKRRTKCLGVLGVTQPNWLAWIGLRTTEYTCASSASERAVVVDAGLQAI
jgi:hypothetical protein